MGNDRDHSGLKSAQTRDGFIRVAECLEIPRPILTHLIRENILLNGKYLTALRFVDGFNAFVINPDIQDVRDGKLSLRRGGRFQSPTPFSSR